MACLVHLLQVLLVVLFRCLLRASFLPSPGAAACCGRSAYLDPLSAAGSPRPPRQSRPLEFVWEEAANTTRRGGCLWSRTRPAWHRGLLGAASQRSWRRSACRRRCATASPPSSTRCCSSTPPTTLGHTVPCREHARCGQADWPRLAENTPNSASQRAAREADLATAGRNSKRVPKRMWAACVPPRAPSGADRACSVPSWPKRGGTHLAFRHRRCTRGSRR